MVARDNATLALASWRENGTLDEMADECVQWDRRHKREHYRAIGNEDRRDVVDYLRQFDRELQQWELLSRSSPGPTASPLAEAVQALCQDRSPASVSLYHILLRIARGDDQSMPWLAHLGEYCVRDGCGRPFLSTIDGLIKPWMVLSWPQLAQRKDIPLLDLLTDLLREVSGARPALQ